VQDRHMPNATQRKRPVRSPARTEVDGALPQPSRLALGRLPQLLGYSLRRAQLAVFADFHIAFAPLDLRPAQFSALLLIDANPGCKQSEAAEALGIMQPNFVALMDDLEARGLARRALAKVDRRSHALELTARGRLLLARAMTVIASHEARVTGDLSADEARQLFTLLARVEQTAGGDTAGAAAGAPA
jgi:DNA-binding MarR family transcriptional regulator